tara:strand:+ start:122 stop:496 length:375 start_codon:yes stop_codon:yes gene_type:complete
MINKVIEFFSQEMIYGISFFILGHTLGWFAGNSQFVWSYWQDKPILATILFGTPAGLAFWYGSKFCFEATGGELWSVRFLAAVFSYTVFPVMTWYFLNESMFTTKTMISVFLALSILFVQIYYN